MKDNSKSVQFATLTILHAGNARKLISDAYTELSAFNFEVAREKIELAREEVVFAHREQSKIIKSESEGDILEFSLLLTHAQDTLMTAVSEIQNAKNMINLVGKLYKEIHKKQ
jgi:PTS system cellobiose-specific IIA component